MNLWAARLYTGAIARHHHRGKVKCIGEVHGTFPSGIASLTQIRICHNHSLQILGDTINAHSHERNGRELL